MNCMRDKPTWMRIGPVYSVARDRTSAPGPAEIAGSGRTWKRRYAPPIGDISAVALLGDSRPSAFENPAGEMIVPTCRWSKDACRRSVVAADAIVSVVVGIGPQPP